VFLHVCRTAHSAPEAAPDADELQMNYDDDLEPRLRGRRPRHKKVLPELVEPPTEAAQSFLASVQVTKAERAWIGEHLLPFREGYLIDDVVRRIKAGKEATVFACTGHVSTGRSLIAAKLYRARSLRGAKNIGRYQLGRGVMSDAGQVALPREWRLHKAIAQKSQKGVAASQTSWLMHEFELLRALHARGAHVPEPIAHNEYALLMEFVGDGDEAAPALNEVTLDSRKAKRLFDQLVFDVETLLELGWVHGDLSAHNLLYDSGRVVLIDFPQVVACRTNPDARAIFERDMERIAQYFARAGVPVDHRQLSSELWSKHVPDLDLPESSSG
jgi:RIO kinase 1